MLIAFQMDPIEDVDIDADSSFRLAEEAQARGHDLMVYTPDDLFYRENKVCARARRVSVQRVAGDHVQHREQQQKHGHDDDHRQAETLE